MQVDPLSDGQDPTTVEALPLPAPAPPPPVDDHGVADLSLPDEGPVRFRLYPGGEVYEGPAHLAGERAIRFMALAQQFSQAATTTEEAIELVRAMFAQVLRPESHQRFVAGLGDFDNPISLRHATRVIDYVFSRYGMRPTQPSPPSLDGAAAAPAGPGSTAAPPSPASTSAGSPSTGS